MIASAGRRATVRVIGSPGPAWKLLLDCQTEVTGVVGSTLDSQERVSEVRIWAAGLSGIQTVEPAPGAEGTPLLESVAAALRMAPSGAPHPPTRQGASGPQPGQAALRGDSEILLTSSQYAISGEGEKEYAGFLQCKHQAPRYSRMPSQSPPAPVKH